MDAMSLVRAAWRLCRRGLFRVVAAGACVALCIAVLAGAPARAATDGVARAGLPAAALPPPIVPGQDLVFSEPYTGNQAAVTQFVTTTFPQMLGLPASPGLSAEVAAVYERASPALTAAGIATTPPPAFPSGSTTVSPTAVTSSIPAADIPGPNDPSNPASPGAVLAAGLGGFAGAVSAGWWCAQAMQAYNAATSPLTSYELTAFQTNVCNAIVTVAGAAVIAGITATWAGATVSNAQWLQMISATFTPLLASSQGQAAAAVLLSWIGSKILPGNWYSGISAALNAASTVLGSTPAIVGLLAIFIGVVRATDTAAGWNPIGSAAGVPTIDATGAIASAGGSGSLCADAYGAGGAPADSQVVAVNTCDGSADQAWTVWSNGTVTNGGLCLVFGGPARWAGGWPLQLNECSGGGSQEWSQEYSPFELAELYSPYYGLCLAHPDGNTSPGTVIVADQCDGQPYEAWALPGYGSSGTGSFPSVTGYGPIDPAGECADAYGTSDKASPGQEVAINGCDGDQAQDWATWSDGTVRAWNLCLDTTGGTQPLTGTPLVDLEPCDGAASQVWTPQSDGALLNSASGTCLDDPFANTSAGVELDVYPCNGSAAQQWTLPPAPPGGTPPPLPANASVCDIYASGGTPCVAAYSMTRALYAAYDGPLYQVMRASDDTTQNIGLLAAGGYVNAAAQDSFCFNTGCTVTKIYDQSPNGNDLTIAGPGGPTCSSAPGYSCSTQADHGADASMVPVTVDGSAKIEAYGLDITGGVGYADDTTTGIATGSAPEGTYMVASGTHVNGQCCMDFGNAEKSRDDDGNGHMDAVRIGTGAGIPGTCWFTPCNGSGPWVGVDMENGTFLGANGSYPGNTPVPDDFVTAMAENNGQSTYAIEDGNAQAGDLTVQWSGALPDLGGYSPMQKEGGIVLGTGGDNSNAGIGTWFEGVMTAGYPSYAADAAVQANIVAAGYEGDSAGPAGTSSSTDVTAGTAGQAVLHDGYTSVYTVDAKTGDLDETYLPAVCAPDCAPGQGWATQDLSATAGTPPVLAGTQPVALYHDGYTSVYTVDAKTGDLDETYLAAICAPGCAPGQGWAWQDLSATVGTPETAVTPSAVYHDGYVSVYTINEVTGDLDETYLAAICAPGCAPGQGWAWQDLSAHPGTPPVLAGTSPVAVLHDGYVSVYTVDGSGSQLGQLQETYLASICAPGCAPGAGWATQDLSAAVGTPLTFTTPGADYHSGYVSVYTVDASGGDLDETYLAAICAPGCAPGQGWAWQDLSATVGTPPVENGTSPTALFHDGFNSVYTVDAADGHLDETYLPAICAPDCAPGQGWAWQDLSAVPGTPPTDQTPIALLHLDQNGDLNWVSVWTIDRSTNHLDETYLPALCSPGCAPGQGWAWQDLSVTPGTPPAT
jgi:hypothetical protein